MSSKAHAQHNKAVCELLLSHKNFNDWVVTTAFYSALHYVQSKVFPYTDEKGATHNNIDEYLNYLSSTSAGKKDSKHSATIKLVNKELRSIRTHYRWLYDTCMTARYSQYKVPKSTALEAKESLLKIEAACD